MLARFVQSLLPLSIFCLMPWNASASLIFNFKEVSRSGPSIVMSFEFADDAFSNEIVSGSWINKEYLSDGGQFFTGNGDKLLEVSISTQSWENQIYNHDICFSEDYNCIDFAFSLSSEGRLLGEFWTNPGGTEQISGISFNDGRWVIGTGSDNFDNQCYGSNSPLDESEYASTCRSYGAFATVAEPAPLALAVGGFAIISFMALRRRRTNAAGGQSESLRFEA